MRYTDPIEEAYSKAVNLAWKERLKATASVYETYTEAMALARETYQKMKDDAYKITLCKKEGNE